MSHPVDTTSDPAPRLPSRSSTSHKGDYGRALLVGGSRNMSGAVALSGMAALRSGAGLVTLAVPCSIQNVVASHEPSYMTAGLAEIDSGEISGGAFEFFDGATFQAANAVAIGPGMGRGPHISTFVQQFLENAESPAVVDADALNALAEAPATLARPAGPRILTPHPGEFARLSKKAAPAACDEKARARAAVGLAAMDLTGRTIVVLKGSKTIVASSEKYAINQTGNPGMATAGSGDVLTGVITALLCQGLPPFDAARLGVHVHGLAGDLAARELGETSLIARDLIRFLPQAFQRISEKTASQ